MVKKLKRSRAECTFLCPGGCKKYMQRVDVVQKHLREEHDILPGDSLYPNEGTVRDGSFMSRNHGQLTFVEPAQTEPSNSGPAKAEPTLPVVVAILPSVPRHSPIRFESETDEEVSFESPAVDKFISEPLDTSSGGPAPNIAAAAPESVSGGSPSDASSGGPAPNVKGAAPEGASEGGLEATATGEPAANVATATPVSGASDSSPPRASDEVLPTSSGALTSAYREFFHERFARDRAEAESRADPAISPTATKDTSKGGAGRSIFDPLFDRTKTVKPAAAAVGAKRRATASITDNTSSSVALSRAKRSRAASAPPKVGEPLTPEEEVDEMLAESGSEYEGKTSASDDDESSDTVYVTDEEGSKEPVEPAGSKDPVGTKEPVATTSKVKKSRRKSKGSGVKKVQNVSGKLNCPFADCEYVSIWMQAMKTHLMGKKHGLDKSDPRCSAKAFRMKRVERCKFCGSEERNRTRHEKNSCLENPNSLASARAKENKRKKSAKYRSKSSSVTLDAPAGPLAGRAKTSADKDGFSKGAPEFRERFKKFLYKETNSLSTLTAKTSKAYYRKSKEILKFWESNDEDFYMDHVIAFDNEQHPFLPSPELYLETVETWPVKHAVLNAYAKMVVFVLEILRKDFLNKIDHLTQYQPAETHLNSMAEVSRALFKVVNKNMCDYKIDKDREKVRTKALKISTERMTALLRAFHQSVYVKELKRLIVEQGLDTAVERRAIEPQHLGNFLMALLLVGTGGHRGEAIRKISISEYQDAPLAKGVKVIHVFDHKTPKSGAVLIPLSEQYVPELMEEYLANCRVEFQPHTVPKGEKVPRNHGEQPFFTNQNGSMVNDMRAVVKFIRVTLSLKIHYDQVPEDFSASAIRTWVANVMKDDTNAWKRMNHSAATHDRHYVSEDVDKGYEWSMKVLDILAGSGPVQNAGLSIDLTDPADEPEEGVDASVAGPSARVRKTLDPAATAEKSVKLMVPTGAEFSTHFQKLTPADRDIVVKALSDGKTMPSVSKVTVNAALAFNGGVNDFVAVYDRLLKDKNNDHAKARGTLQSSLKRYKWPKAD